MDLKNLLSKVSLRQDLANHAVYGTLLYWAGSFYTPLAGLALAGIFALVKEFLVDKKMGLGQFDPLDIFWTVLLPVLLFGQDMGVQRWIQ